jgi:hypothetical protein
MNSISVETIDIILPPNPFTLEEVEFVPGSFDYVSDNILKTMLKNAYDAINLTETWEFIKQDIESFMFSTSPEVTIIFEKMIEIGYSGHSGCSFGWTMRQMQFIAKKGEQEYKKKYEEE